MLQRERGRERERERERDRERDKDRKRERETDRQTDRQTEDEEEEKKETRACETHCQSCCYLGTTATTGNGADISGLVRLCVANVLFLAVSRGLGVRSRDFDDAL